MKDGSKVEVPMTPLKLESGFTFKTKERKICMTPEGKRVVHLVRSVSRSKTASVDHGTRDISIIQPLDWDQ